MLSAILKYGAAVVDCVYLVNSIMGPQAQAVAVPVGGGGGVQATEPEPLWTKPMIGWVKLNVSGSRFPQNRSAGCGGVLRDSSGKWLSGFAQKLKANLEVEIDKQAILKGLQWAMGNGVTRLIVESDNERIVNFVNNGPKGKSFDPLISDIKELLDNPRWQVKLTWIHAKANQFANKVAENSCSLPSFDLRQFDYVPTNSLGAISEYA